MRLNTRTASSIASTLPSLRMLLLFGGFLALSESIALATTLLAGAFVSFAASLVIATTIYRSGARRRVGAPEHAVPSAAASINAPR